MLLFRNDFLTSLYHRYIQPRVEERLKKVQTEVTNIKATQQQSDAAADERATKQTFDIREVQHAITNIQASNKQIERSQKDRVARQQVAMHKSFTRVLNNTERRVAIKLDRIEAAQLANVAHSTLISGTNKHRSNGSPAAQNSISPPFQGGLSLTCWQCSSSCPCSCHKRGRRKRTPTILDRFIGVLFVGYLGLPYFSEPCDTSRCLQRSIPGILMVYFFPTRLLARAIIILMRYSSATGPELTIRVPRIVSFEASILE